MGSASTRPRRCGFIICRSKNSARWPTGGARLARAAAYDGRGNEIVTYIVDRNINYTNVCNVYCKFCAFYRTEKDADAYVITLDEMDQKIEETLALGGTQILLQGGHHPKLTKQWYLDLLAHMKGKFPQVNIHGFSPSEFVHFREVFQRAAGEDHCATSRRRAWAPSPAAAARSWWTACASASRRSRR